MSDSGGTEFAFSGGIVSGTTGSAGGYDVVLTGGTTPSSGETVSTGVVVCQPGSGVTVYTSGASDISVGNGATEYVLSQGTAISTTVTNGGVEGVYLGGLASSTTVSNGGTELVSSGGTAIGTTVDGGGTQFVFSGGTASFTSVAGGTEIVSAGGTVVSTTVRYAATEDVDSGGQASNTTVNGGYEYVSAGGSATGTTLNSGGHQFVSGTAVSTTINSGTGYVYSGGTISFTVVNSGSYDEVAGGGTAVSTTINNGGVELLETDAGTASSTEVNSGGVQNVLGIAVNTTVSNGGEQYVYSGGTSFDATVDSGGSEIVFSVFGFGNDTRFGVVSGTTVNSGGFEILSGGGAYGTTLNSGGTEVVNTAGIARDTMMNVGGAIDVAYLSYTSGGSASVNTSNVLTVSVGGGIYTQQLAGTYIDEHFLLAPDTGSGTLVMAEAGVVAGVLVAAQCYRRGTHILTDHGEVAVEDLRVGERVRTVLGEASAPIIWIGQREVDCTRHPKPWRVWPVRVADSAFGPGRPHGELFLSPDHAVYVNEVLIPIRFLINDSTIVQVQVDRVAYYHIELPEHGVVLAQGLPAESFLDMRDRSNYANRPGPVRLFPDFTAQMWEAFGCARLVVTGPELAAVRALVGRFVQAQVAA
jgi:autotransporter passenger strand-loop-strand repeat protein